MIIIMQSEIDDESARAAEEKIAVNLDIEDEKVTVHHAYQYMYKTVSIVTSTESSVLSPNPTSLRGKRV